MAQTSEHRLPRLDSYGQLLQALLPKAQSTAAYTIGGVRLRADAGPDGADLRQLALELLAGGAGAGNDLDGAIRKSGGATRYGFLLRDGQGLPFACVALLTRQTGKARPLSQVAALLRPALDWLRLDLSLRARLGALSGELSSCDRDLELLLDAADDRADAVRGGDELSRLVQAAADHCGCVIGTLIVPELSIAVVRTPRGRPAPLSDVLRDLTLYELVGADTEVSDDAPVLANTAPLRAG